jgi:GntR family transcriptional regulator
MPTPAAIVTEPVYQQLARICRDQLRKGTYGPGDIFPSERDLVRQHKVSRVTANKVISNMVAEGLLQFRPGLGTVVRESAGRLCASLREMKSFTHQVRAMGRKPRTDVLAFRRVEATALDGGIQTALGLDAGGTTYELKRLRKADGVPAILEYRWLREDLVPRLTRRDVQGSLYEMLEEKYGLVPSGEQLHIRARRLTRSEAGLMQDPAGAPALEVSGVGFLAGHVPLWHQVLLYRADLYELVNVLQNLPGGCHSDVSLRLRA